MAKRDKLPCKHCGELEEDHHSYEPITFPHGCKCKDWQEWGNYNEIPPVCSEWVDGGKLCATCEHEKACHEPASRRKAR